jgi:cobalt-zinc-cadmium efflux system outer membrane protein
MAGRSHRGRRVVWVAVAALGSGGCAGRDIRLPPGNLPPLAALPDGRTTALLVTATPVTPPAPNETAGGGGKPAFELPGGLPGGGAPPIQPPPFQPGTPQGERLKAVEALYPDLKPVEGSAVAAATGPVLSLADLQQMAAENSPVLKRAAANADAVYGRVIQVGLYPNPTIGYQVDQWQPSLRIPPGSSGTGQGQQGGFISQLIKTAGKLEFAQRVAGFDYINALVAVRRAQIDVTTAVRTQYFAVLVARQGVEINRTLAGLADDVYRLQLKLVAAGQAAGYEPLQLYAQSEQARNALTQSENAYKAAWRQLAAAVGRPDLSPAPLAGQADAPAPALDLAALQARILEQHTDLLTARNTVAQAQTGLDYQRRLVIPDLQTNQYHEYDNLAQTYQFGVQLGITLPLTDRNQGNIRTARSQIGRATAELATTQNDLFGRLGEAFGRYEANRAIAARYRDRILPSLTRAYQAIVRRYQVEPAKVSFNDIVVAQQNVAQALQAYLTALDAQWRATVDLAALGQLDELYAAPAPAPAAAIVTPVP